MSRHGTIIFDRGNARCLPLLLALAGAAAGSIACRPEAPALDPPPPAGATVLELIPELPAATVAREAAILELGQPAARPHLAAGWSTDEEDADGTFVWGLGGGAAVTFFATAATDVTVGLHCKPLDFEDAPEQTMSVALNGQPLGEVVMGRKLERYRIEAPATAVASATNRLDLSFGYHRRPRDVIAGAADERELAVRCYRIELEGLGADASPRVDPTGDRIELPVGTAATFYFDHAAGAELVFAGLETWGPRRRDVRLLVRSRSAEATRELEHVVPEGRQGHAPDDPGDVRGPLRLALASEGPAIDRLELAAVADDRGRRSGRLRRWLGFEPEASGLSLVRPTILDRGPADGGALADGAPAPAATPASAGRPNVIVYLIDTLRADHLGTYGYPRPTSPEIDRFAKDGVVFDNAQAQSSWTRPAVVSLLTGLRPRSHGVNRRQDALPDTIDTLAELLAGAGYDTAGFVTNGNAGPDFGLDQGFAEFRYLRESAETRERHRLSDHLNLWLFDWLENRRDERPFFLYAHATDPHAPYTPPEPFRRRFAPDADPEIGRLDNVRNLIQGQRPATEQERQDLLALYDAEIAFNDHHFGRFIERLKELGLYQSSLIVLLSDHGEEFLDHGGWEHGVTLYGEQLHVPLIVKLPGGRRAGTRVAATVSQVDVLPTILDLLGLPPAATTDGANLFDAAGRPSFAYLSLQDRRMRGVTRRGWKLIVDASPFPRGRPLELYRLEVDRGETAELATEQPFERELLAQILRRWEVDLAQSAPANGLQAEIPDELRRQLEALGYL